MLTFLKVFGLQFILNYIPIEWLWILLTVIIFLFIGLIYFLSKYIKFYIIFSTLIVLVVLLYSNYRIKTIINDCQYNMKSLTEQILEIQNDSNKISEKIIIKYKDRIKYIDKESKKLKQEIKTGITKDDDLACKIPQSFIDIHNKAAQLK